MTPTKQWSGFGTGQSAPVEVHAKSSRPSLEADRVVAGPRVASITFWQEPTELEVHQMRDHNPDDFVVKLSAGELPVPEEVSVFGMVKPIEGSSSVVSFTKSLKCEEWLSLPTEMVESFTHLKNVTCGDHEHPLVKVKFKRLGDLSQDVAFFAVLYSRMQSSLTRARLDALLAGDDSAALSCEVLKFDGEAVICCDGECGGIV